VGRLIKEEGREEDRARLNSLARPSDDGPQRLHAPPNARWTPTLPQAQALHHLEGVEGEGMAKTEGVELSNVLRHAPSSSSHQPPPNTHSNQPSHNTNHSAPRYTNNQEA